MKKYKIRDTVSGKFVGGKKNYPRYFHLTDKGITWGSKPKRENLEQHLMDDLCFTEKDLDALEIVEYNLQETKTYKLL